MVRKSILFLHDVFLTSLVYSEKDALILAGSRNGTLFVVHAKPEIENLVPILAFHGLHDKDAITDIVLHTLVPDSIWSVSTVGRDGMYTTCTIDCDPDWNISKTHTTRITKGWLEKIINVDGSIFLLGFFDKKFFVYNESKKYNVFDVDCGGGHRIWDCLIPDADLSDSIFTFIRNQDLYYIPIDQGIRNPVIEEGFHALETQCVEFLNFNDVPGKIVVSGGEEGILTFHDLSLKRLTTCRKHLASIKCVAFDPINSVLFSAGSAQELKAFKVEPILVDYELSSLSCVELASAPVCNTHIEARVMDIDLVPLNNDYLVATANSDGATRLWKYGMNGFTMIDEFKIQKCVLKSKIVKLDLDVRTHVILFTGATNGILTMWDISCFELKQLGEFKIHQSGIKALHVEAKQDGIECLSGGDDNAVTLLRISFVDINTFTHSMSKLENAHGSCVVGCYSKDGRYYSVSIDQRFNQYSFNKKLVLEKTSMIDIVDASDMAVNENHFAIVGHGIQIFQ